jgi:hypothetical protein
VERTVHCGPDAVPGRMAYPRPPIVVGAYRQDELRGDVVAALAALSEIAQPVPLPGLSPAEVDELVAALAGEPTAARWGAVVAARSEGHPFFARELTYVLAAGGEVAGVPAAIRELVARRLARLTSDCVRLLETCAVAGAHAQPDVLADATGHEPSRVADLVEEAVDGGVLTTHAANTDLAGAPAESVRFGHDLYRESIYASLARTQRVELHRQVGEALVRGHARGAAVFPAELARHFAASAAVTGARPALAWAPGPPRPTKHGSRTRTRQAISPAPAEPWRMPGCRYPMPTWSTCSPPRRTPGCAPATPERHTRCSTPPGNAPPQAAMRSGWVRWRLGRTGLAPGLPCRAAIWSRCWSGRGRRRPAQRR